MAKVTGPVFSMDGRGSLGDGITYTGCPGGNRVILRPRHGDAKTVLQTAHRSSFTQATSQWKALPQASRDYYDGLAAGLPMSGYNFYVKQCLLGNIALPTWHSGVLDLQVAASADDCAFYDQGGAWAISLTAVNLHLGYISSVSLRHGAGLRFLNVTIPKGATITAAVLKLTAKDNKSATVVKAKVIGDAEDNAATFSTAADYKARRGTSVGGADNSKRTVAEVQWDGIGSWAVDVEYSSPDIKAVIQEIVDRAGWASGNALALFVDDHDARGTQSDDVCRQFYSYNASAAKAPKLHVEYQWYG